MPGTAAELRTADAPRRELADGLYAPGTYLTAKLLEEGAVALVQTLALSVLTYFPLRLGGQWLLYWFVYFQTTCIGIGAPHHGACSCTVATRLDEQAGITERAGLVRGAVLAYLVAALSPNIYVANAALPVRALLLLLLQSCALASTRILLRWVAEPGARAGIRGHPALLHRLAHAAGRPARLLALVRAMPGLWCTMH